jgi:hypothetical protein
MNKGDKRIVNRYLHEIRHLLPIVRKPEKRFLADIRQTIDDYIQTTNQISFDILVGAFGEPKDIVASYILEKDAATLREELRITKYVKYTFYILISTIILLAGLTISFIYMDYKKAEEAQIDHEVIVIEEEIK